MTLRKRLGALEARDGTGREPMILILSTVYEDENGQEEDRHMRAILSRKPGQNEFMEASEGEADGAFKDRVHARCLELFGRLPASDGVCVRIPDTK